MKDKIYNHNLVMVNIDKKYLDYLRNYDNRVPKEYINENHWSQFTNNFKKA